MLYITGSVVRKRPVMMYKRIRDPPRDVICVIVGEAAEVARQHVCDGRRSDGANYPPDTLQRDSQHYICWCSNKSC